MGYDSTIPHQVYLQHVATCLLRPRIHSQEDMAGKMGATAVMITGSGRGMEKHRLLGATSVRGQQLKETNGGSRTDKHRRHRLPGVTSVRGQPLKETNRGPTGTRGSNAKNPREAAIRSQGRTRIQMIPNIMSTGTHSPQSGKSASVQSTLGHSNVNFSIDLKNKCGRNDSTSVFSTSEASPAKNVGMHTESSRKSQDQQVFLSM